MKKLYSTIMMLAMMVAALSSLTACGGSDDEGGGDGGTLVGKWKCTYVDYGKWVSYNVDSGTSVGDLIYFNADNTYYTVAANVNDSGTWSLSGNQLTIKSNDPNSIKMVYDISLTGNTFTITIDSMIFKYVRVDNGNDDDNNGASNYSEAEIVELITGKWEVYGKFKVTDYETKKTITDNYKGTIEFTTNKSVKFKITDGTKQKISGIEYYIENAFISDNDKYTIMRKYDKNFISFGSSGNQFAFEIVSLTKTTFMLRLDEEINDTKSKAIGHIYMTMVSN